MDVFWTQYLQRNCHCKLKHLILIVALTTALIMTSNLDSAQAFWIYAECENCASPTDSIECSDGRAYVGFESSQDSIFIDSVLSLYDCNIADFFSNPRFVAVTFDNDSNVVDLCDTLETDQSISLATPEVLLESAGSEPYDEEYQDGNLWYLKNDGDCDGFDSKEGADIKATLAWDIQKGSPEATVVVWEHGFPTNPAVNSDSCDSVPTITNWTVTFADFDTSRIDFAADFSDDSAYDTLPVASPVTGIQNRHESHGTAVCAIIASTAAFEQGEDSFGGVGVANGCKILPMSTLRWEEIGSGIIHLDRAVRIAVSAGAEVLTSAQKMPFDFSDYLGLSSEEWREIMESTWLPLADSNDILMVFCVGNQPAQIIDMPACFALWGESTGHENGWDCVIAVSGTGPEDEPFRMSSGRGNGYSTSEIRSFVSAPAQNLTLPLLTWADSEPCDVVSAEWADTNASGTSYATPMVAGLGALIRSQDPTISAPTVRDIIAKTADKVWQDSTDANIYVDPDDAIRENDPKKPDLDWRDDYWDWHPEYGYGRINCYEALRYVVWDSLMTAMFAEDTTETWEGEVILHGDVYIPEGCVLTLDEGTIVRASSYDVTAGGTDTSKIEFIVNGVLNCNGSDSLPVCLTSKIDLDPSWYGVTVESGTFSHSHTYIVNAEQNLIWEETLQADTTWSGTNILYGDLVVPAGVTLTLNDSTVVKAARNDASKGGVDEELVEMIVAGGTLLAGADTISGIRFESTFQYFSNDDKWYGIRVKDSGRVYLKGCEIHDAKVAVDLNASTQPDTVQYCDISNPTSIGIYARNASGGAMENSMIAHNTVTRDSLIVGPIGIRCTGKGTIDHNTIEKFDYGIEITDSANVYHNEITDCNRGISTSFALGCELDNNYIGGETAYGLYLGWSDPSVYDNEICNESCDQAEYDAVLIYGSGEFGCNKFFNPIRHCVYALDCSPIFGNNRQQEEIGGDNWFRAGDSLAIYTAYAQFDAMFCYWQGDDGNTTYTDPDRIDTNLTYPIGSINADSASTSAPSCGSAGPKIYVFEDDEEVLPEAYWLSQNFPNPFNPTTAIEFSLENPGHVKMRVYNVLGQYVTTLVDEYKQTGLHRTMWDGKDSYGNTCASGIYFYKLETGDYVKTKKMMLVK